VVLDHCFHLGEADGLDADSGDDLLVGEGEEELATYGGGGGFAEVEEDD
jgi:hypothetical protein